MKTLKASPSSRQASLSRQSNTNRPVKTRQNLSVVASARRTADPTLPSRVEGLLRREIAFVHHRGFARTNLDSARRELDLDSSSTSNRVSRPPADVPAYFAELYLTPLLSAEGESRLFRLMNLFKFRANALRATLNVDRPDPLLVAQIEQLLALAAGVRERIIRANLRLVVSIARRFANDICSFDDLVSDGNVALLNAVEKFDFSRGFRFSTYATHAIQRDFFRIIRKRRTEQSRCSLGISEMLANTPDDADPVAEQTEKIRQAGLVRELITQQLNPREQLVVALRFGLQPGTGPATLQVVADTLQVSKERVRQIELRAIEKLQRAVSSPDELGAERA